MSENNTKSRLWTPAEIAREFFVNPKTLRGRHRAAFATRADAHTKRYDAMREDSREYAEWLALIRPGEIARAAEARTKSTGDSRVPD